MKKLFLFLISLFVVACATPRSEQIKFGKMVSAEDKVASKLVYLYLDSSETITYLSYDAMEFDSAFKRYQQGDFRVFASRIFDGPTWVALKPGNIHLAIFKAGYTTGFIKRLFTAGYYRIEKSGSTFEIVSDPQPNLTNLILERHGIK